MEFSEYFKNSMEFNYLKNYYNSNDIAKVFGIQTFEIKHSNFLKYVFEPSNNDILEYFPIKQLLKLIQNHITDDSEYKFILGVDFDKSVINNVHIAREENNIDLLIRLEVNQTKYIIVIENKIEASERENQLYDYKKLINDKYSSEYNKIFVLLHPNYEQIKKFDSNELLKNSAIKNNYISITYQDIYDILNEYAHLVNSEKKILLESYIHALSCFFSNNLCGLIINNTEKVYLEKLFNDSKMKEFLKNVSLRLEDALRVYNENKDIFNILFRKYTILKNFDNTDEIIKIINQIIGNRKYFLNNQEYNSIYSFVYSLINDIVLNEKISTVDDFGNELKLRLIGVENSPTNWIIHSMDDKLQSVPGGYIDTPIKIGNVNYYCAKWLGYPLLVELCDLVIKKFPRYKEIIEI